MQIRHSPPSPKIMSIEQIFLSTSAIKLKSNPLNEHSPPNLINSLCIKECMKMDIRSLLLFSSLVALTACPFDSNQSSLSSPLTLQGAAVKAPIANANVSIYTLDLSKADLKGDLVSSGQTSNDARFEGVFLPNNEDAFLLEVDVTEDSEDVMVGTAPLVKKMRSFIIQNTNNQDALQAQGVASPLTDMVVEIVARFADKNTPHFNGNEDGEITTAEWLDAVNVAQSLVKSVMGYGLIDDVDLLNHIPMFDEGDDEAQQKVLHHRLAIETASTLISTLDADAFDEVSIELAKDLADGELDGQNDLENASSIRYQQNDISTFSEEIKNRPITQNNQLPTLSELKLHLQNEIEHINRVQRKKIQVNMDNLSMPARLAQNIKADHDDDGLMNALDADDDGDGFSDNEEKEKGTHHLLKPEEVLNRHLTDRNHKEYILSHHDYAQLNIEGVTEDNLDEINTHIDDLDFNNKSNDEKKSTLHSYVKISRYFKEPDLDEPSHEDYQRTNMAYLTDETRQQLNQFTNPNEKKDWRQIKALSKLVSDSEEVSDQELSELSIDLPASLPKHKLKELIKKQGGKSLEDVRRYTKRVKRSPQSDSSTNNNPDASPVYHFTPDVETISHQGFPTLLSKQNNYRYGESRVQRNDFFQVSPLNTQLFASAGNMKGALLVNQEKDFFTPVFLPSGQSGTDIAFSKTDENKIVALMFNNDGLSKNAPLPEGFPFGIYRSHDKGNTWQLSKAIANRKQEPTGNNMVVWGEGAFSSWVFVATHQDGLLVSTDSGITFTSLTEKYASGLNDLGFSALNFVRTLAVASSSTSSALNLYAIANVDYEINENGRNRKAPDGDLFIFTLENGQVEQIVKPDLYQAANGNTSKYADIAMKTGASEGFALVKDKWDVNLEGVGGRILARVYDNGNQICDKRNSSTDCNTYQNLPGKTADNQEICNVLNNPFDPNMWVLLRGGETKNSVLVSLDDGVTWQYESREIETFDGNEYVKDFAYSSNMLDSAKYDSIKDQDGKHYLLNSAHGCQGPSISFVDQNSFVIIPISKEKPAFITRDQGNTFTSFSKDSENKWLMESAISGDYQLLAFGEYGYMYTVDGGASYRSLTDVNHNVIDAVKTEINNLGIVSVHGKLARGQNVALKENDNGFVAYALYSIAGYLLKIEYNKLQDSIQITRVKDASDQQVMLSYTTDYQGKINFNSAAQGIWINDDIYFGNLVSRDNGQTFQHLCEPDCSASDQWYMVLAAHPQNSKKIVAMKGNHRGSNIPLFISHDAGQTWEALPDNGLRETSDNKPIRSFLYFGDVKRGIQFDPNIGTTDKSYALLLAGRGGMYRFHKNVGDDVSQLTWALQSEGFKAMPASKTAQPWLSEVLINPVQPNIVVTAQSNDKFVFGQWLSLVNIAEKEMKYESVASQNPLYISYDGGETWFNLVHPSLPEYFTFAEIKFNSAGDLYIFTSNYGYYVLKYEDLLI